MTDFHSTRLKGTMSCNRDGLLYTSIPQNGNWRVWVDGKEEQTELVGSCMLGVPLQEGNHEITFRYENPAYSLGWRISLLCFSLFGLLIVLDLHRNVKKQSRGKFSK